MTKEDVANIMRLYYPTSAFLDLGSRGFVIVEVEELGGEKVHELYCKDCGAEMVHMDWCLSRRCSGL